MVNGMWCIGLEMIKCPEHVFELIYIASWLCTYDLLYETHHMVTYVGQQTPRWLFWSLCLLSSPWTITCFSFSLREWDSIKYVLSTNMCTHSVEGRVQIEYHHECRKKWQGYRSTALLHYHHHHHSLLLASVAVTPLAPGCQALSEPQSDDLFPK